MQPYLKAQLKLLVSDGQPFSRPLWFDAPDDPAAAAVDDQFFFGPDYLVAPVTTPGATNRTVVFPAARAGGGTVRYQHYFDGSVWSPGTSVVPVKSLTTFPLFKVLRSAATTR